MSPKYINETELLLNKNEIIEKLITIIKAIIKIFLTDIKGLLTIYILSES